MSFIGYLFFRVVVFVFYLIPYSVLYKLSDFTGFVLYKIVGYRRKVVFTNLKNSFPEKTDSEIETIARLSYQNLADILLEGIKGFSISEQSLRKRYIFRNPEIVNDCTTEGGNSIILAAHYGNWEWGTMALNLFLNRHIVGFYKPLNNAFIDAYARRSRGSTGMSLISIAETAQAFETFKDTPTAYVFVSDQSTYSPKAHWVHFLNQDTACPYGGDKYAHLYNYPVFYLEIQRVKRGFYEVYLEELAVNAASLPDEEITKRFMSRLEKQILTQPQDWLWSHKRWKMKRPT